MNKKNILHSLLLIKILINKNENGRIRIARLKFYL